MLDDDDLIKELDHESKHIKNVSRSRTRNQKPEWSPEFDGTHCIECDEDIPEKRLEMGKIRCQPCQQTYEKMIRT